MLKRPIILIDKANFCVNLEIIARGRRSSGAKNSLAGAQVAFHLGSSFDLNCIFVRRSTYNSRKRA